MIEFSAVKIINPTDLETPRKYYTKEVKRGEIQFNTLAREISEGTALAALHCLLEIIPRYLSKGFYVKLGDFGTFYPSLKACGLEKPEEVIASSVIKVKVMIRAGYQLAYSVGQAKLQKIALPKEEEEKKD